MLVIAEAVTGIDHETLAKLESIGLLDSAVHAPQASFGGTEFYPDPVDKAAVLGWHLARNHGAGESGVAVELGRVPTLGCLTKVDP
ncbi:MAG: hypothetical protein ACRD0L_03835 [Acidimicrobiales bacterium]